MMDANKIVLQPDLLADLVSHQAGFISDSISPKLRTCVELCYNGSLPHHNIILYTCCIDCILY